MAVQTKYFYKVYGAVLARDGKVCQYCGSVSASQYVLEHVVPERRGGPSEVYNCVIACGSCNRKKGNNVWQPANLDALAAVNPTWAAHIRAVATIYAPPPKAPKFSVHGIETTVIKRLKQAALDQDRTISEVVATAFAEYLERHEVRHAPR